MVYRARRPTYRRRYVRRYNKTPYKKRIAKMGAPKRRAVVHLMNKRVETKMNYQFDTATNVVDAAIPFEVNVLTSIVEGTASDARIGDVINLANIKVKYKWTVGGRIGRDATVNVRTTIYIYGRREAAAGRRPIALTNNN